MPMPHQRTPERQPVVLGSQRRLDQAIDQGVPFGIVPGDRMCDLGWRQHFRGRKAPCGPRAAQQEGTDAVTGTLSFKHAGGDDDIITVEYGVQ